jgi:cholesterol transport system auxiliary component
MSRLVFLTLPFALFAAGCAFKPVPKPEYFMLNPGKPPSLAEMKSAGSTATASVAFVDVAAPFAADGFVYQVSNDKWEIDPYNQFLVSPADMMTTILRNWTRESGLYGDLALPGTGGGQGYVIDCDLTELYGDFRNPMRPEAVVTISAQVFHNTDKGRVLVLRKVLTQRVPVAARTPSALIDAWNEALRVELNLFLRALAENRD